MNFLLENGGDEEIKYTGEGSESHIEEERKLSLGQGEVMTGSEAASRG